MAVVAPPSPPAAKKQQGAKRKRETPEEKARTAAELSFAQAAQRELALRAPPQPNYLRFRAGQKVDALFCGSWDKGLVRSQDADGTYTVEWVDDHSDDPKEHIQSTGIQFCQIRPRREAGRPPPIPAAAVHAARGAFARRVPGAPYPARSCALSCAAPALLRELRAGELLDALYSTADGVGIAEEIRRQHAKVGCTPAGAWRDEHRIGQRLQKTLGRGWKVMMLKERRVSLSFLGHPLLGRIEAPLRFPDAIREVVGWPAGVAVAVAEAAFIVPGPRAGRQGHHSDFPSEWACDANGGEFRRPPHTPVGACTNIVLTVDGGKVTTLVAPGWSWSPQLHWREVDTRGDTMLGPVPGGWGMAIFDGMLTHAGSPNPVGTVPLRQIILHVVRRDMYPVGNFDLDKDDRYVIAPHYLWRRVKWV